MAFVSATERDLALKKIVGKAHTSPDKEIANEALSSGLTISAQTVFGEQVPSTPSKTSFYTITGGVAEYVRLPVTFIPGTDTDQGRHSFSVRLPDDYVANSSNPKAGTGFFVNGQEIYETLGGIQLIPTTFGADYEAIPHYGDISALERVYPLDERDWSLDYFNGVFFQQDPPGTGAHAQNPTYIDAFIYIGDTLDTVIGGLSGGGGGVSDGSFITIESESGMSKERKLTIGTGLSGVDGGENSTYEISVDSTVVPLLAGASFTGDVSFNQGLSGSLQTLQDGSSYLVAGNNIQIQSGSSGQVTISSTATGGNTGFTSLILGADTLEASVSEDITFVAGSGMQISADALTNTMTFEVTGSTVTEIIKVGNTTEEVLTDNSPETLLPFILTGTPVPASSLAIFVNGIRLSSDVDFTYDDSIKSVTIPSDYNIGSRIIATYNEAVSGVVAEDDPRLTDDRTTGGVRTQTTIVSVSGSTAPTEGQVLIAESDTQASWGDFMIFNEVPTGIKDDVNQDFSLSQTPLSENDMMVFVNGLLQKNGTSYDVTLSGNTLTFAVPPNESDMISATYRPNYS